MPQLAAGGETLFLIERHRPDASDPLARVFWTGAGWTYDIKQGARYPHETAALELAGAFRLREPFERAPEVHPYIFT